MGVYTVFCDDLRLGRAEFLARLASTPVTSRYNPPLPASLTVDCIFCEPLLTPPTKWSKSRTKSVSCTRTSYSASGRSLIIVVNSVHDGWGIAPEKDTKGDAISAADTTNMDTIAKEHSHRTLHAHGIAVGLSEGLMGNSEVGYDFHLASLLSPSGRFTLLFQPFEHRCRAHRLAGYCAYRCSDQEAPIPQKRNYP